jgi:hypothetical protein
MVWHLFSDERARAAVEVAERYAEGLVGKEALAVARDRLRAPARSAGRRATREEVWNQTKDEFRAEAAACVWAGMWDAASETIRARAWDAAYHASNAITVTAPEERAWKRGEVPPNPSLHLARQAALLRDLFGPQKTLDRKLLAWCRGVIPTLAAAIYDERAFDRLPILGDALEDAGCTDQAILGHCRSGGEHVRGCWVVDLCLEKT